jgi:transcriptional regulator with XRE-family HTH domain
MFFWLISFSWWLRIWVERVSDALTSYVYTVYCSRIRASPRLSTVPFRGYPLSVIFTERTLMNLKQHVAAKIRTLRAEYDHGAGLPQEQLATELDVATNTVSRWETGTYWPSIEDLDKLARFFHVSVLEFFPKEEAAEESDHVLQLMRATKGMKPEDLEEVRRYAEFRRARHRIEQAKQKKGVAPKP